MNLEYIFGRWAMDLGRLLQSSGLTSDNAEQLGPSLR
jgi:hypothetical protein